MMLRGLLPISIERLAYQSAREVFSVKMDWDPTVEFLKDGFYHINVGDTQYKTFGNLQDLGTDVLLSRAARIFQVAKVGDTEDNFYVLKDLWLKKDRRSEHQIYEDILRDVRDQYSEQDVHTMKRHILTPIDSTIVKVNDVEDDTETIMMRSHTLKSEVVRLPILVPSHNPAMNSKTFPSPSDMEVVTEHDIKFTVRDANKTRHRWHQRIVFKEFAEPIYEVKTMGDVFTVLADLIKGQSFERLEMANIFSHSS
jgi:hypothetical protein